MEVKIAKDADAFVQQETRGEKLKGHGEVGQQSRSGHGLDNDVFGQGGGAREGVLTKDEGTEVDGIACCREPVHLHRCRAKHFCAHECKDQSDANLDVLVLPLCVINQVAVREQREKGV